MAAHQKSATPQKLRRLNGKVVRPVLYNGRALGHGKYFAGEVDNQLVCDAQGKPFYFKTIGTVSY